MSIPSVSSGPAASAGPAGSAEPELDPAASENRRQVLYWRLLARIFAPDEQPSLEAASLAIVEDLDLPAALLDPTVSIDNVVQRFPALAPEIDGLLAAPAADLPAGSVGAAEVRTAAVMAKLLLNTFATGSGGVTAGQLADWQADAGWLRRTLGPDVGDGPGGPGAVLGEIEADLVSRMHLREVLANPTLARRLTPSMSLIEQLLRDKDNLSGVALANAKALIRRFVDEVAEVLRTQVEQTSAGTLDRSVPPKRVFRNLDLDRTIWKNLPNWSPEDQRLYVDRLYYRQTARRTTPAKMIVVVDQSGSMVDSMVNCTILASIFAGLPRVDVHLIAYDTRALDLTPWVNDPFEVLLRTKLGGGNDGPVAMEMARPKISDPRNTVMVWISDFYEFDRSQPLFEAIESLHRGGVRFIPVGSVNSSGRGSVNPWFRERFKDLGTPVISGHIRKLVAELKNFVA
ncbi:vWA domain-containing protein [Pseudofrankia inefficax]|uniref:VWA containing CoxE family protein n=1 Tax=Pseudofrankia inefficax (strain DSM 45817 / CECT 9037 / DDB 130130 / EuI1c) TaxID=298654 RepID=E3J8L5_PSEI1|nr:VWA domain-containing protein [Pseudofrankia inefficax]ADP78458.1 VWA containing CoxE family protein [Pseudofrankia inefficax]